MQNSADSQKVVIIGENNVNKLRIKNRFSDTLLSIDDIYYIQTDKRKVRVYTEESDYWEYNSLKEILKKTDGNIYKCHSRLAINLDKVSSIDNSKVLLNNGQPIFLSRLYMQKLRRIWNSYLDNFCFE